MRNSMDETHLRKPSVWGPQFWKTYDIIANTYPKHPTKSERRAVVKFFESQKYLIPCATCAINYKSIIDRYPPEARSRQDLQKWLELLKQKVKKHTENNIK